jgi:hypothetical protein
MVLGKRACCVRRWSWGGASVRSVGPVPSGSRRSSGGGASGVTGGAGTRTGSVGVVAGLDAERRAEGRGSGGEVVEGAAGAGVAEEGGADAYCEGSGGQVFGRRFGVDSAYGD